MRLVVQRVLEASVTIDSDRVAAIGPGLLALVGFGAADTMSRTGLQRMARRLAALRVFDDAEGRLNRSISDIGGELLLVPQITLTASMEGGNRPSFHTAAAPAKAEGLFAAFVTEVRAKIPVVKTGVFQAQMRVALVNDGPVTILLEEELDGAEKADQPK